MVVVFARILLLSTAMLPRWIAPCVGVLPRFLSVPHTSPPTHGTLTPWPQQQAGVSSCAKVPIFQLHQYCRDQDGYQYHGHILINTAMLSYSARPPGDVDIYCGLCSAPGWGRKSKNSSRQGCATVVVCTQGPDSTCLPLRPTWGVRRHSLTVSCSTFLRFSCNEIWRTLGP